MSDLPEEKLDADAPSELLAARTSEARERLVPREREWDALEDALFARIDEDLEDAPSPALAQVTREARDHLRAAREPDWDAIERKVHARTARPIPLRWSGVVAVGAIAAAAAWMLSLGRGAHEVWEPPPAPRAGTLGANEGHVTVAGHPVSAGQGIQLGDRVEVGAGHAVFDQAGRVTWSLEGQSRARVTRTEGGLVLALEQGATEAQVVPVPNGEAFAVDVADAAGNVVRVAVHGTHLRVARSGDHVTIDLTEGVVSVGRPPRAGSTYGKLITAPAHVELEVSDVEDVKIDHEPAAVRRASPLAFAEELPRPRPSRPSALPLDPPKTAEKPIAQRAPIQRPTTAPDPTQAIEPDPLARIREAARACFAEGSARSDGLEVHLSVSTEMVIPIDANGMAHTFTFTTPLPKPTQDCVSRTVWSMRFPESSTTLRVPLDLSR